MSSHEHVRFDDKPAKPQKYVQLRTIGKGFHSEAEYQYESDPAKIKKIEDHQEAIRKAFSYTDDRATRRENHFICKSDFLLKHQNLDLTQDQLIYLLTDTEILFSPQFQIYRGDRHYNEKSRKRFRDVLKCEDDALQAVPDADRDMYRTILRRLRAKADSEKKHISDLQRELLDQINVPVISDSDAKAALLLLTYTNNLDDMQTTFDPELNLNDVNIRATINNYANIVLSTKDKLDDCKLKLRAHLPQNGRLVRQILQEWIGDVTLTEEQAADFIPKVLSRYTADVCSIKPAKEASGHFHRDYRVWETNEFVKDCDKRKRLETLLEELRKWQDEKLNPFPYEDVSFFTGADQTCDLSDKQITAIRRLTKEFLQTTRSQMKGIRDASITSLTAQVYRETKADGLFPICYLILCVAGTGRVFTSGQDISYEQVEAVLKTPYRQKPSIEIQRFARIRFVKELIDVLELASEESIKNWRAFLQIHEARIGSIEENALWHEILQSFTAEKSGIIPPIEVQMIGRQYLEECLPIQPERLLSYIAHSELTESGYAEFYHQHQDLIRTCASRVQNSNQWKEIIKVYNKYWAAVEIDLAEARDYCKSKSELLHWESIQKATKCNLGRFCNGLYSEHSSHVRIDAAVEELKSLILETALRIVLTNQARDILRKKIEETLNNPRFAVDFHIEIPEKLKQLIGSAFKPGM